MRAQGFASAWNIISGVWKRAKSTRPASSMRLSNQNGVCIDIPLPYHFSLMRSALAPMSPSIPELVDMPPLRGHAMPSDSTRDHYFLHTAGVSTRNGNKGDATYLSGNRRQQG